ncbi:hypothetical protein P154DRAFT_268911 [Amniculicola lignicola CBS 123094]|uniref:Uncharacterized protein n=1 Tax=Amniculicola lignicola CBS 123094 TaxID=1392246 RepID=A0A6A5W7E4_9PLEO|nr:hypothetical protein P154DRAFT_268911 [Amniculicola lignicola CBS 123094]
MAEDDAISSLSAGRASKNQAKGRISDWTNQLKPVPRKPANGQLPKGTKGGASTRLPLPVPTSSPLPILDTGNQLKRPRNRSPEPKNAKPRRSHASSDFAASENSEVGALPRSSSSLLAKTIKSHLQSLPITNIRQGRSTIEPEKKDRPKRNQGPKSSPERRQANFDDHAFFFNLTDKLHRKAVNPTRIDDIVNFTDFDNVKYPVEVAIPGQKGEYWEARNQEELRDEKERLSKRKRGSPQTETTTSPHQSHAPLLLLSAKALLDNHVRTLSDNMFFVSAAAQGSNNKWSMVERNKIDKLRDKFMEAIHQAQYEYGKGLDELNVSFQLNKPQAEQESEDDGPWVPINRKSRNTSEKSG